MSNSPSRYQFFLVCFSIAVAQMGYGGFAIAAKLCFSGEEQIDPILFTFLRNSFATPLLFLLAYVVEKPEKFLPDREDWLPFLRLGLFANFFNHVFNTVGLKLAPAFNGTLIQQTVPAIATIIAGFLHLEVVSPRKPTGLCKIIGIVLSLLGAVMILLPKDTAEQPSKEGFELFLGNVFFIINGASYACSVFLQRPLLKKYPPVYVTAWTFCCGAALLSLGFLGSLGTGDILAPQRWHIGTKAWLGLAYSVIVGSVFGFAILSWGNKLVGPVLTTSFTPLQPVMTALLSSWFLDYHLETTDYIAATLIFSGLFAVTASKYVEGRQAARQKGDEIVDTDEPASDAESRSLMDSKKVIRTYS
ncbi:DUF6-domain-containing protein [Basidiobolus meristosporus CBS 931.73]|uniref:DUF6-domain-containing protein n=1 Tax=Basidiobolus meristosporus CBS 931.73 TaxID=1314790 RepID=A0A1Y1WVN9_9FUNG|nr:DUF6-domain-containing protein [Basidiobolus meristosporus CBS 931.73]|eukprot:ORX77194.1 DUF6-domain-containing protein [Basidiobolus meristosporus CBS 931.73]